jgi:hypothetical protein
MAFCDFVGEMRRAGEGCPFFPLKNPDDAVLLIASLFDRQSANHLR